MYIGNLMLLVLNLPLVGLFVSLLRIPYVYLAPVVLLICVVGIYSVTSKPLDIFIMAVFGMLGYVLRKFDFDVAPLLLAIVLGDRMEVSLRRALVISDGDYGVFLQGAFSQVFIGAIALLALLQITAWLAGFRKKVLRE
jgi:putative tricarboxylic transport membrane protein